MHSRRIGAGLACRAAASLFASTLLAAQPLPQGEGALAPHKQAPKEDASAAKCGQLALRDALSAKHAMPDVQGCAYQAVLGYFAEFGGHAVTPRAVASPLAAGTVTRQAPAPGTALATGEPVTLYVASTAPPPAPAAAISTVVPDVLGKPVDAAEAAMLARQLRPVFKGVKDSPYPRGEVSDTTPPRNTTVDRGTEVDYWTASGFNEVPKLPLAVASAVGVALVLGGGWWLRHRLKIARTRRLLKLKPSCSVDGVVSFASAPHFNAPTVALRSRLDDGETRFPGGLPVLHVEIRHE
jgi:hypothetical protein